MFIFFCLLKRTEIIFNTFLCFIFHLQFISSKTIGYQKFFFYQLSLSLKYFLQNFIRNKRPAIPLIIEKDPVLTKLVNMNRNTRGKPSHYTLHSMGRNTPDAEETKYMINTESIKIITHLFKALFPPGKIIFLHFFPIIGWKTPILTNCSKVIWRSTGLPIHIVHFRSHPGITTISRNANRNITFQNNSFFMGIINSFF